MIIIPTEHYSQDNKSDKTGNIYFSKCIEYDSYGYMRLGTRAFTMMNSAINGNFQDVVGIEFSGDNSGKIITTAGVFNFSVDTDVIVFGLDAGAPIPSVNSRSDSWQQRLYISTDTGLFYYSGFVWTNTGVVLNSGFFHPITLFRNRNELAIGNDSAVILINTAHATTQTLQLPTDMEVVHIVYNNNRIGVLTKTNNTLAEVRDDEAYFFVWDGTTAEANTGVPVGSIFPDTLCAYKSSWVVLNREGRTDERQFSGRAA